MQKLNQVVQVEHGLRSRIEAERTELYHTLQKTALFDGLVRTYQPSQDDGERLPPETRKVQQQSTDLLRQIKNRMIELFDITATKDWGNCNAKADVTVDGVTLLTGAPATFLLWLEKELTNVRTLLDHLPILDPAETWTLDSNDNFYKNLPFQKNRTQKVAKPIVLHPPTKEHPAQTQMVTEDVTVGYWTEQKTSGAFPAVEQRRLLTRVEKLQTAVKVAREEANLVSAPKQEVGAAIFEWLFK